MVQAYPQMRDAETHSHCDYNIWRVNFEKVDPQFLLGRRIRWQKFYRKAFARDTEQHCFKEKIEKIHLCEASA